MNQIRDQFIFGISIAELQARDLSLRQADYHLLRDALGWAEVQSRSGGRVLLLSGEVCDGKTIAATDIANLFSVSRPVFWMGQAYDDILDEVARILERYPNSVLVIENCFELRTERLSSIAGLISSGEGVLLLTARSIAADAETGKIKSLKHLPSFREHRLTRLSDSEVISLERLIDQFGGFAHLGAMSVSQRQKFILNKCGGSLPAVLLDIVNSPYVKEKYEEELRKLDSVSETQLNLLIAALYAKHIGDPPPVSFLSDIFRTDVGSMISVASKGNNTFHLLRIERGQVETVPALGASLILREFFSDRDIVSSVIFVLEEMSYHQRSTEYERYIFSQMMRYSRLSTVVDDVAEIQRFFDHISKIDFFRQEPLFWLQWHMAKAAEGRFVDAERLLDRGYAEAANWEKRRGKKYNKRQLDDRRSKYLMHRAAHIDRSPTDLFRDFGTSLGIIQRILRELEITHHPYQTLESLLEVFVNRKFRLIEVHAVIINKQIDFTIKQAEKRLGDVPEGYQKRGATVSLHAAQRAFNSLPE